MLSLVWPWALALSPLPLLYRYWRKPINQTVNALIAPAMLAITKPQDSQSSVASWLRNLLKILLTLCWLCAVVALARPQWIGDPVALPTSGRDLLLAVDISPSMRQRDMRIGGQIVNRLVAVKSVVGEFVEKREGDRLGLVLFGEQAYLQTPLTFDRKTLQTLLYEAQMGFAGSNGTAIGDAIGLAVKRLQDRPKSHRVVILLTDGANNAGALEPIKAAQLANRAEVKIYTIGVGARGASGLDEKSLAEVAKITGGQFFRARNPAELEAIYQELNRLEPLDQEAETIRPTISLYHWPLGIAFVLSLLIAVIRQRGSIYG
ncbi:MAG: VWA domain-containing protein [Porticoccaceae bacterium]|jgi:Ca-activated chloride channel family protein